MKNNLKAAIIYSILGIMLGVFFMFFADKILKVFLIILGILIIIMTLPAFIFSINNSLKDAYNVINLCLSIINIILGCLLIFVSNDVLFIIAGIWILIEPILKIVLSKEKGKEAKENLATIILGITLILLGSTHSFGFFAYLVGGIFVTLSLIYLIYFIALYFKENKKEKDEKAIDA